MMPWRDGVLGDAMRIKHGFAFKGEFFSTDGSHVVLTPGNFKAQGGLKFKGEKEKYYTGPIPEEFVLKQGDLLVAMTDLTQNAPLLGSAAIVPVDDQLLHNQRLGKVINIDDSLASKEFLYWLLNSEPVRAQIRATATGATVKHTAPDRIYSVRVQFPPLEVQRQISERLAAYDDLIENCERRIKVLDEMARALYREWLVELRYPGHEGSTLKNDSRGKIPNGWRYRPAKEIAEVTYGFPFKSAAFTSGPQGLPLIRIRDIPPGRSETYTEEAAEDRYRVADGDVLVGMDGDFHMGIWSSGPALLNQRVARFRVGAHWSALHYLLALRGHIEDLNHAIVGTTVAHLGDAHIKKIDLVEPRADVLAQATAVFEPIERQQIALKKSIHVLARVRDLLLPRLLSGHLSVSEAG